MGLEARSISFSYSSRRVLSNVSFTLDPLTAILGRNGSGKTTLLRILVGFLRPSSGSVLIDGEDALKMKAQERARLIAYIPQSSPVVYPHTVRDLVLMGRAPSLSIFAKPGRKDEEAADEAIETLGISYLRNRPINATSGGERQLALIARALCQDARILILDEPASALDYSNQLMLLETLEKLSRKGYQILYSTHNPDHALMASDKILLIDSEGRVESSIPDSEKLSELYGRKLLIRQIDTGKHTRCICIPE